MTQTESVWYRSYSLDGVFKQIIDGDYFKTCDSVEEVKEALERLVVQFHTEGTTYAICKETYRRTYDDNGNFTKKEDIVEVLEHYIAGGHNDSSRNTGYHQQSGEDEAERAAVCL